ncbi:MAG: methyltransferase domain-containing protein [Candidatus Diapherotrites archaeon]
MGNFKAEMFNKKAAGPKSKPGKVLTAIAIKKGQKIADIGTGGGYFSLRFAEIVGEKGRVYAVDTNKDFLEFVESQAKEKALNNVITVQAQNLKSSLPEKGLDLIFLRNVSHHLENRTDYFKSLKPFLKDSGQITVIEYKKGKPWTFRGICGHHVPKETIMREMNEAGYALEKEFDFLPEQHFTIYSKKQKGQKT